MSHKEVLANNPIIDLPLLALIIFVLVFAAVVFRVWRSGKDNPQHDYIASLPLFDDEGTMTVPASPSSVTETTTPGGDSHGQG